MKIKERLYRFMYGRYGSDQFSRFLLVVYFIIAIGGIFATNAWVWCFLHVANLILFIYMFFRMFSRNIYARQGENQKYLRVKRKIGEFFKYRFNKWKYRKTHVYRKCTHCRSKLRLPKKKGEHSVKCPKCMKSFSVKI